MPLDTVVTECVKDRSNVNEIGSSMPVFITLVISLPIRIVTCMLARSRERSASRRR
ncbi:MAG: hypothetical protein ACLQDY_26875 [Streptosporangiaceae bacterium]